jgi:hypothetical protein
MNNDPSVDDLQRVIEPGTYARPRIAEDARELLGATGDLLDRIGLPVTHADWFRADKDIEVCPQAEGARYCVGKLIVEVAAAVRIGSGPFGVIILNCSKGHVVYVDQTTDTELINTSLSKFLYFVGRLNQSADRRFTDVAMLRRDLEAVDPLSLENTEGIWAVTIEEAEAGLY